MKLEPLGEAAFLARELHVPAYQLVEQLDASPMPGLLEAVAAYDTVGLFVDPDVFDPSQFDFNTNHPAEGKIGRLIEVPCRYDGPDLAEVADRSGMGVAHVAELHANRDYRCYAVGFCPGFPYLGYLPDELVLPRREEPRQRVAAGSVAIAGRQTGIYPLERPGGWWLIGSTDFQVVDLAEPSFAIRPGDIVRFVPIV